MNQNAKQSGRISEESNRELQELRTRLLEDAGHPRGSEPVKRFNAGGATLPQNGILVFSVLDDLKIYGSDALDTEFATRQYDPYTLYKQASQRETEVRENLQESA